MFEFDNSNRQTILRTLPPGKYTVLLQSRNPVGAASQRWSKVTVTGPAEQHGWSSNGSWFLHKPAHIQTVPHYVLPVRKYREQKISNFWIGFIGDIKKGWQA